MLLCLACAGCPCASLGFVCGSPCLLKTARWGLLAPTVAKALAGSVRLTFPDRLGRGGSVASLGSSSLLPFPSSPFRVKGGWVGSAFHFGQKSKIVGSLRGGFCSSLLVFFPSAVAPLGFASLWSLGRCCPKTDGGRPLMLPGADNSRLHLWRVGLAFPDSLHLSGVKGRLWLNGLFFVAITTGKSRAKLPYLCRVGFRK